MTETVEWKRKKMSRNIFVSEESRNLSEVYGRKGSRIESKDKSNSIYKSYVKTNK